jgi:hypothetical protein
MRPGAIPVFFVHRGTSPAAAFIVETLLAAIAGGVTMVQLRDKHGSVVIINIGTFLAFWCLILCAIAKSFGVPVRHVCVRLSVPKLHKGSNVIILVQSMRH